MKTIVINIKNSKDRILFTSLADKLKLGVMDKINAFFYSSLRVIELF